MQEEVILVDENDIERGVMEKMEAHIKGELHRAFSIFIFNSKNQLLLQQRALTKYHSAGLWTNTCCSHPRVNESNINAANRRLMEEMGMTCELDYAFNFTYKAEFGNGLTEHEFDHVFIGFSDELPVINPTEVNHYRYEDLATLSKEIEQNPELYTAWLKLSMERVTGQFDRFKTKNGHTA